MAYKIILGSQSPRRQELLRAIDLQFEVRVSKAVEIYPSSMDPKHVAAFLSNLKGDALIGSIKKDELLITADSIVVCEGKIYEKSETFQEAFNMISLLVGKQHLVYTGVTLQTLDKKISFTDTTKVKLTNMTADEITYYVNKYQPFDKAGSYGIQDWIGWTKVEYIEGSYANVMGLPVHRVYDILKSEFGLVWN